MLLFFFSTFLLANPDEAPPEQDTSDENSSDNPSDPPTPAPVESIPVDKTTLPSVVFVAPINYPERPLQEGRGADVRLELHIDSDGQLLSARVSEPVGDGFDEAALEAIENYRFSPALDALGNPAPAHIEYVLRFEPQKAPVVAIKGTLREAGIRRPLSQQTIDALGPEQQQRTAITDENGLFRFSGLEDGEWIIRAGGGGLIPKTQTVRVQSGQIAELNLYLIRDKAQSQAADLTMVVEEEQATAELTVRSLSRDEIRFLPGANGDVVKAIQNLPGVARSPFGFGGLIIRGLAPDNSSYQIDGMQIPIIFHFGGLTTVINSDSISEVAYLPGNYGVRYGRQLGGVVDMRTKELVPERDRGYLSADLFHSTLFIEKKVGSEGAFSISGRRSYADVILNPVLQDFNINVRAPRYYDFQVRYLHKSPQYGTFDAFLMVSDDRFSILGAPEDGTENAEPDTTSPPSTDDTVLSYVTAFQKIRFNWKKDLGNGWKNQLSLLTGPQNLTFELLGENELSYRALSTQLRQEVFREVSSETPVGWRFGLDFYTSKEDFTLDFSSFDPEFIQEYDFLVLSPALYAENTAQFQSLQLITGLRGELFTMDAGDVLIPTFEPRVALRWLSEDLGTFRAGAGIFAQFPALDQLSESSGGTPDLAAEKSIQYTVGWNKTLPSNVRLDVTAFYSDLKDLVRNPPSSDDPFDSDPGEYDNTGYGRVYGLETQVQYRGENTIGLLSATFSRSTRFNRRDEERLFRYDQPYIINAILSRQFPKNVRLGARLRYGAGNPYTPVVNRVYNLSNHRFRPVYGERDSGRLPAFLSLDVRYDKEFVFNRWTFNVYIDIQNITNATNVEVMQWSYDYTAEEPIQGLPLFPIIGLKGEY
ncbi:MAG: TonB family protein [Myxococcota bacterium]|nr:TonB family protein [Myxococcota bacterium]